MTASHSSPSGGANKILIVVCVALFALSVYSYSHSVRRAERFERGQNFLPNLNPDSIAEIEIKKGGEDEGAHLRRDGDRFVVVDAGGYPAKNESVNRFIRDVLKLSLEKKVGRSESLVEELELTPGGEDTLEVVFKNENDAEMVHFLVGKSMEDGGGSYVMRTDGDDNTIYLTNSRVYLSTGRDDFLDKEILNVESDEIAAIRGRDFTIENHEDRYFELVDMPAGKQTSSKFNQLKNLLSGLRFTEHHLADATEVQNLRFDSGLEIDLKDGSGYRVAVASEGDKHYLQIQGYHNAGQLSIAVDADEEEAAEVADQLKRQNEVQDFNDFHGSWIYEVTETTANRVAVEAADLVEDA